MKYSIREYVSDTGFHPYRAWLATLTPTVAARIQARVFRFECGNLGDYKSLGVGVFEARFRVGSGYRLYFAFEQSKCLLLLFGGDKRSQKHDIEIAKRYLGDFRRRL